MTNPRDRNLETTSDELQRTAVMPGVADLMAGATDLSETATWVAPQPEEQARRSSRSELDAEREAARGARERLEQTVHALTVRLRELEERVQGRSEELHEYERQLNERDRHISELNAQAGVHDMQLRAARTEQHELQAQLDRSTAQVRALEERLREAAPVALSAPPAQLPTTAAVAPAELQVRADRYLDALRTLEARRQIFDDMLHESEMRVRERDEVIGRLEKQLSAGFSAAGADRRRLAKLDGTVDELSHQLAEALARVQLAEQRATELEKKAARTQESSAAAANVATAQVGKSPADGAAAGDGERIGQLEQELADHAEMIRLVHRQLNSTQESLEASQRRAQELQAHNASLESQLRSRPARGPEADAREAALRAELEKLAGALQQREQLVQRLQAESRRRSGSGNPLLVRRSGDTNIAHVLSGRTTIGRTPDNAIQIDTPSVSRHHAVLLLTAEGTVVEDLSSTNGVYVNGTRVRRQPLREGDLLTIGNTEFRFVFKPAP